MKEPESHNIPRDRGSDSMGGVALQKESIKREILNIRESPGRETLHTVAEFDRYLKHS
jgi:hypothetical protein